MGSHVAETAFYAGRDHGDRIRSGDEDLRRIFHGGDRDDGRAELVSPAFNAALATPAPMPLLTPVMNQTLLTLNSLFRQTGR